MARLLLFGRLAVAGLLSALWTHLAVARTLVWTGSGGDGRYANAANWGGTLPQDGDCLSFTTDGTQPCTFVNDLVNFKLGGLTLAGSARQIHRGNPVDVAGDVVVRAEGEAELAAPLVGKGTLRVRAKDSFTLSGANGAFAGTFRIEAGQLAFRQPRWHGGMAPCNPMGGAATRIVVDNSKGTNARILIAPYSFNGSLQSANVHGKIALLQGDRPADVAWLETTATRPVVLWGKVVSAGRGANDGLIRARAHLTFAGGVTCRANDFTFRAEGKGVTFTFTGRENVFADALNAVGNVTVAGRVRAPSGVRVTGGQLTARILPEGPGGVFFVGAKPRFVRACEQAVADGTAYALTDWYGRELSKDAWPKGEALALAALPRGYYWLRFDNSHKVSFAVLDDPATRVVDPERGFATCGGPLVDAELDCPWYGGDTVAFATDLLTWMGAAWVRHGAWMDHMLKKDGSIDFNCEESRRLEIAQTLTKRGIRVCAVITGHPLSAPGSRDLAEVSRCWRLMGEQIGTDIAAVEFQNECDARGAPPWGVASELKAALYGLRLGNSTVRLGNPAITGMRRDFYVNGLWDNGVARYTDFVNYHYYGSSAQFPASLAYMRQRDGRHGLWERELWITEQGAYTEGFGREPGVGRWARFSRHSEGQELAVAEYLVKNQLLNRMLGVKHTFSWTLSPFNEYNGAKDWSFGLRRDGLVKPGYAAFATMARELGTGTCVGSFNVPREVTGVLTYLYRMPDGTYTLAYWSCTEVDSEYHGQNGFREPTLEERTTSIPAADGTYRNVDMCGTVSSLAATKGRLRLTAQRYPQYVSGLRYETLEDKTVYPAVDPGRSDVPWRADDADLSIVMRVDANRDDFWHQTRGDRCDVPLTLTNAVGRLSFECWNLSDVVQTGTVRVVEGPLACDGLEKPLVIPPRGKLTFTGMVRCEQVGADAPTKFALVGTFNGKKTTPLAFAFGKKCDKETK